MADPFARLRRFLRELKRRNVYKVAVAYLAVSFVGLQAARLLVPATTLPGWADELVIYLAVFGFPVALVLAWAFEMTAEGVRRTPEAEGEAVAPSAGGAGGWIAALVVLLLAGGGFWYLTAGGGEEPKETSAARDTARTAERSVAVLPFDNLSGTEKAQPFVNGIHDDLLTRLSNVSDLKVISRTSVLPYRDTELSLPAIADSLGVTWIVEGGVQQAGDRVQVNAQLIQAEEDAHKWAETYRRKLTTENLFAVQSELTKKIARSLEAELTPQEAERVERRPTESLEAYRLYVQGRGFLDQRTESGMRTAIDYFRRALKRDSTFARAWAALAEAEEQLGAYGHVPVDSVLPHAWESARRALELDPTLAEAHASAGLLHHYFHEGPAAIRELKKALQLNANLAQAHRWLGYLLHLLGRPDAIAHARRAVELNPRTPEAHGNLAVVLHDRGRVQKALHYARRGQAVQPGYGGSHIAEVMALYRLGRVEEAISLLRPEPEWAPSVFRLPMLAVFRVTTGDTARARKLLGRLQATDDQSATGLVRTGIHYHVGSVHAALGERQAAFRAFDRIEGWGHWETLGLRYDPLSVLASLRDDPRYEKLIREMNQAWGLNPDGSLPDSVDVSFDAPADD